MAGGQRHFTRGFTLIELSIVLVIIGLIVGGVLAGQNLIASATLRAEMTQLEKWSTAVETFRGKYNCLPGDCANASQLLPGGVANGNGVIEAAYIDTPGSSESTRTFVHLSAAGLVAGNYVATSCAPGVGIPASVVDPNSGYVLLTSTLSGLDTNQGTNLPFLGDGNNWFRMINGDQNNCYAGNGLPYWGFTPAQLYQLDAKFDDGMPYGGSIRLMGNDDYSQATTAEAMCVDGGWCGPVNSQGCSASGKYLTDSNSKRCPLARRED